MDDKHDDRRRWAELMKQRSAEIAAPIEMTEKLHESHEALGRRLRGEG